MDLHILDTPPELEFEALADLAQRILGTKTSALTLVDADRLWFKAKRGMPVGEVLRAPGLCSWVAEDAAVRPRASLSLQPARFLPNREMTWLHHVSIDAKAHVVLTLDGLQGFCRPIHAVLGQRDEAAADRGFDNADRGSPDSKNGVGREGVPLFVLAEVDDEVRPEPLGRHPLPRHHLLQARQRSSRQDMERAPGITRLYGARFWLFRPPGSSPPKFDRGAEVPVECCLRRAFECGKPSGRRRAQVQVSPIAAGRHKRGSLPARGALGAGDLAAALADDRIRSIAGDARAIERGF